METIKGILEIIRKGFISDAMSDKAIIAMLLMVLIFSLYECLVYYYVSHKQLYNRSFNISIMIMPFFIAAIIMCLQANIVVTLGTIGALAIIRYRTAVKDPTDMLYILWSVFIGIMCGCQLYKLCLFTSLIVTVVLILVDFITKKGLLKKTYYLIAHGTNETEEEITALLKENRLSHRIKSRNYSRDGIDLVYEIVARDIKPLTAGLETVKASSYSIVEYDNEDVI